MRVFVTLLVLLLIGCTKDRGANNHAAHQLLEERPGTIMLTNSQVRLANITTERVSLQSLDPTVVLNGRLVKNEDLTEIISSRVKGRIEKLFVKETGKAVGKGEPLYEIYSEMLLTLQKEYLLAKEQSDAFAGADRYASFLKSSEKKLLLYGMTQQQITRLGASKDLQPRITFLSPGAGIVTQIDVAEGGYVEEGSALYTVENINKLWVEAELYPLESSRVKIGDRIKVRMQGLESEPIDATIDFLSPELRQGTQIVIMRSSVDNSRQKFKPGMQAQVTFAHSSREALALPVDAVIRGEKGPHVYIQNGPNTFRPREVKTGVEDFTRVEIIEGLNEGDTVAVTGAYLIYSEIVLKKGFDPMDHHH